MSVSPAKTDSTTAQDAPGSQPKAPVDPNVETLQAAFPDIDAAVISAVLMASGQNLERSFDALLGMSDPSHKPEVPSQASQGSLTAEQQRQIDADEELARQIGIEDRAYRKYAKTQRQRQQEEAKANQEPERNFMDDELPVIKETIIQGFNETKSKVSGFLANLKEQYATHVQEAPESTSAAPRASFDRLGREQDRARASLAYEADPDAVAVLDDDFNELELHDATSSVKPTKPASSVNNQDAAKIRAQSASKWEKIEPQKKATPLSDRDNFDIGSDD